MSIFSANGLAANHNQAPTGNDISWPQCGKKLPKDQAFGIVGVNGGKATSSNPCLANQLVWASKSTGVIPAQPKVQLYINTGNPGGLNTSNWPQDNMDPRDNTSPNNGACDGRDSIACAWQYGWNQAARDVDFRFVLAAQTAHAQAFNLSTDPIDYIWWLDVETMNTWKEGSPEGLRSNKAVLEGMTAFLQSIGAKVGIYSTGYQWGQIVGPAVEPTSNLYSLNSWLAGAEDLEDAKKFCAKPPLTAGGKVVLIQYISGNYDYNYSCV